MCHPGLSQWMEKVVEEARPVEAPKEIIVGSVDTHRQSSESHTVSRMLIPPPHSELFVP